jgi:hypothetical protein
MPVAVVRLERRVLVVAAETLFLVPQCGVGAMPFGATEQQALAELVAALYRDGGALLRALWRRVAFTSDRTAIRTRLRFSGRTEAGFAHSGQRAGGSPPSNHGDGD